MRTTNGRWVGSFLLTLAPLIYAAPATVTTQPLDAVSLLPTYTAPAATLSLNDSHISTQTSGLLRSLQVRVGDQVTQGDPLAELDCEQAKIMQRQAAAAAESARARQTLAQRQIRRSRSLSKERAISEELLNQREADLNTARADLNVRKALLAKAQLEVSHCRITAPFSGVVAERLSGEGEWATLGQPLLRLIDNERLEVSAQIPLAQIQSLQQAGTIILRSGDQRFTLRLRRLLPIIDPKGRYREARLEFTDRPALPGRSGRLQWQATQPHLPADIPVRRNGKLGVLVEREGVARFVPLPSALEGQPAPVGELPAESQVIIDGRQRLRDGDPVQLRN